MIKCEQEFINVAAHELRTPIQPIRGLADILPSRVRDGGQEAEYLDVIIRNGFLSISSSLPGLSLAIFTLPTRCIAANIHNIVSSMHQLILTL